MDQRESNDYSRTTYGDYRTIERDGVAEVDQATGSRIFVNRVYNWMFCGLMGTTALAWAVAQYAATGESASCAMSVLFIPCPIV